MTSYPTPATTGRLPDDEAVTAMLHSWLPGQRWFAGGAEVAADMTPSRREALLTTEDLTAELVLISDTGGTTYLVPISWRRTALPRLDYARIGEVGGWTIYDGLHDGAVTDALFEALASGTPLGAIVAEKVAPVTPGLVGLAPDMEQSNTSVVFGDEVIVKFFRRIEPGINPDAEVTMRLASCRHTADPVGQWRLDLAGTASTVALATRYITNCVDGWAAATASVRDLLAEADLRADEVGGDFASESERLGEAVATVHEELAEAFGTDMTARGGAAVFIDEMVRRAQRTIREVPALGPVASDIGRAFAHFRDVVGAQPIPRQRIHGDLHLGQTLRTVHDWVIIDFEGEPSRPLAERRTPAPALKDVAGMLRSFDYAAYHQLRVGADDPQRAYRADEWARRNREAFLRGYLRTGEGPIQFPTLLTAWELDKAIYEVAYEHAHRPGWETIPLAAIRQLTAVAP